MLKCAIRPWRPEEETLIGRILSTSPPIVENIFSYLTARELAACAQVCTFWRSMANIEKKRRKKIMWFCKVGLTMEYTAPSHVTHNTASTISERMEMEYRWEMERNRVEPSYCLAFLSAQLMENFYELFPSLNTSFPAEDPLEDIKLFNIPIEQYFNRKCFREVTRKIVRRHLPAHCPLTLVVSPGIIGCCQQLRPVEVENGPALSGLLLPMGVKVMHIPVTGRSSEAVLPAAPIKCLLAFLTARGMSFSNRLVQSVLLREKCRLAVAGAVVDRTESPAGSLLALYGDNVEAASVIVRPRDRQPEVRAKLERFREAGLLGGRCFALMFACVGRGNLLYRQHNVESSLFRRLYPSVPIVGLFGNGEIGIDYLPHVPSTPHKVVQIGNFKRTAKKYLHSYTTVFVMVSVKD